ncbi:MAG: hypothetical protein ACYTAF_16495, partial [Planctomycetota bacterium]
MRRTLFLLLLSLGACALDTTVITLDQERFTGKKISIAVLDVFDGSATMDPAVLQMNLTRALDERGFTRATTEALRTRRSPWGIEDAARSPLARGYDAALIVEIVLVGKERPRTRGDRD